VTLSAALQLQSDIIITNKLIMPRRTASADTKEIKRQLPFTNLHWVLESDSICKGINIRLLSNSLVDEERMSDSVKVLCPTGHKNGSFHRCSSQPITAWY